MNLKVIGITEPEKQPRRMLIHFPRTTGPSDFKVPYVFWKGVLNIDLRQQKPEITGYFRPEGNNKMRQVKNNFDLYDYNPDTNLLEPISFPELQEKYKSEGMVHLREVDPIFYKIRNQIKGKIEAVVISDAHGAAQKVFDAAAIFPNAKLINLGDTYDRADSPDDTFLLTNLLLTFTDNPDYIGHMGNHDAMFMGAGVGELASLAHMFRFALRYNEAAYFKRIGIDLSKAIELALTRTYNGNYKAKGENKVDGRDINRALEELFTDLQLKTTYGNPSIELTPNEKALLNNIKFKDSDLAITNPALKALHDKIKNKNSAFSADEVAIIERLKTGNNIITEKENELLLDLQLQIIKNPEFRKHTLFGLLRNKIYNLTTIGDKQYFTLHSNIPMNPDGTFRSIKVNGESYAGIELLDALQQQIYEYRHALEELDINNDSAIKVFLTKYGSETFFDRLAWSEDSPTYGRIMKTFERLYLPESSGTYDEPKDEWYKAIQSSKASPENFESFKKKLATELGVDPNSLVIVNGHTPSKDGLIESFHNGGLIRIDGGFSKAYGDMGIATLITDQGQIYTLSLSGGPTDKAPTKIQTWTLHQLVNGKMVELH